MPRATDPAALVMAAILRTALRMDCIAEKTELWPDEISSQLEEISIAMKLVSGPARCEQCREFGPVFRIA